MQGKFLVFAPATEGSGRGAQIGAYDSVSLHHARGACEVITSLCFGNRCEFGTIETSYKRLLLSSLLYDAAKKFAIPNKDAAEGLSSILFRIIRTNLDHTHYFLGEEI